MAAPSSPALRRGQAIRGNAALSRGTSKLSPGPRGRRGSVVHFDEITSIYPAGPEDESNDPQHLQGTLRREPTDEDYSSPEYEDHGPSRKCCYNMSTLLEKQWVIQFFRGCAVLNLLSLACSSPWRVCNKTSMPSEELQSMVEDCNGVFLQFVIIASVDLVVSIVYTIHLVLVLQSILFRSFWERKANLVPDGELEIQWEGSRGRCFKLIELLAITMSLWYSVAIGIYRSYVVKEYSSSLEQTLEGNGTTSEMDPVLQQFFYLAFVPRSLAAVSALQLTRFNQDSTALSGIIKNIRHRWKQLLYVSIFYFFNVYIFALIGVQLLGGLDNRCFYEDEFGSQSLAIPTTHCSGNDNDTLFKTCFAGLNSESIVCLSDAESRALNLNYRDTVYLGQFRTIIDALFAVYEASSLELWSFMEYNGLSGSLRSTYAPALYYLMMVFYLVIFVQQSIFLVVIIESFADLRSDAAGEAISKQQKKPTIVLYEQKGGNNEIGFRDIETQEYLTAFKRKRKKYYYERVEKAFILLVLVDAIIMATTQSGMSREVALGLRYWQLVVSIVFVLEVVGLFVFHLLAMPMQLGLFFKNRYFWFLAIISLGGVAGAAWWVTTPNSAGNFMAAFQALRLIRVLRLFEVMKNFVSTIIGDSTRLLTVVLIVVIFMVWFAVVSMVLVGYLRPEQECERIGSDRFRDFFHSFESMFQLLMQEGWSQLYSEFQCRRDWVWLLINFYFIILHLIASLFLLNFFVAVILDNLDYDEEEKIVKLEEAEKNKEKVQKVPRHLRIFKLGGPKKIPVPKLSSVDAPNLTEADVRNFYNVGEVTDLPRGYVNEHPPLPYDVISRRSSELSNLDLLTGEKVSTGSGISSHQGKYWGIQGILSQVEAFRQHTRENEAKRPSQSARAGVTGDFLGSKPQVDYSDSSARSEYDDYRDKYRLFDRALFCLPPENWLRHFCHVVLTKQLDPPSKAPGWDRIYRPKALFNALAYLCRSMVSVLPYFTWFMLLLTSLALCGEIREMAIDSRKFGVGGGDFLSYLFWVDLIFVFFTLAELVMKIIANGVFLNPHAAIQGLWDVLDWMMVLATLGVLIAYLAKCEVAVELPVTFRNMPLWLRLLHTFRALRPLRLISLLSSMRHVLYELGLGIKKLILAAVLLLLFMFMFSSLGVQLFTGEGGMESFCNDPTKCNDTDCVGVFEIAVMTTSQENLPIGSNDTFILVPRVWYAYHRNFRFDNTFRAFITLFEVLTLEGWLDVRDLYGSMEESVFDNKKYATFMFIYIHIFVFIGVNFGLQIFVGIVVNNFNENKPDHSALLTVSQKRWTELLQRISLTRPIKEPPPPRNNMFRMKLYKIFINLQYKHFITLVVIVNSFLYCVPWVEPGSGPNYTQGLMAVSIILTTLFFVESLLKLLAFGVRGYFQSGRNAFDFLLSFLGMCYVIVAIIYLTTGYNSSLSIESVVDIALSFTVMKLFTILMKYGILQNLLRTVITTLLRSRHLIGVLLSILLVYTFLGNLYFRDVRSGEAINFNFVSFSRFFSSFNLMIRVVTGEDWYTIFQDSMVVEPYCSNALGTCGFTEFAFIFYLSFYVLVSFILLNVVIAVLLENFSIFYNEDDTNLTHAVVKDFQQNWLFYDKNASGLISSDKIKLFLRMLRLNEFHTYGVNSNGIRERQKSRLLVDSILLREMAEELKRDQRQQQTGQFEVATSNSLGLEDKEHSIPFQDVLKMIAYRAEDISQRLVPHELYVREEFENSVQFDVAEQCILKWIKKFVKPVIKKQERTRRKTVSHNVYKGSRHGGDSLWAPLVTTTSADDDENRMDGIDDTSEDSEDDQEPLGESHRNDLTWERKHYSTSRSEDEQPHVPHQESTSMSVSEAKVPALAKSWQRLENAQFVHFKPPQQQQQGGGAAGRDKWHEWFQMQKNWMDNVEEDPDNYFDDNL